MAAAPTYITPEDVYKEIIETQYGDAHPKLVQIPSELKLRLGKAELQVGYGALKKDVEWRLIEIRVHSPTTHPLYFEISPNFREPDVIEDAAIALASAAGLYESR